MGYKLQIKDATGKGLILTYRRINGSSGLNEDAAKWRAAGFTAERRKDLEFNRK